jgi:hypothetical protein
MIDRTRSHLGIEGMKETGWGLVEKGRSKHMLSAFLV